MKPTIHIVAFQRPFPPTYGGVIDMYYRIKAFHDLGLHVVLHTFCYKDRTGPSAELAAIADEIHYYERQDGWRSQFSLLPFIVYSRRNRKLLDNLTKDNAPILFEGLHATYYLNHPALRNRCKIVRAHNIEHNYYLSLAASPGKFSDRLFFSIEALRLRFYEKILSKANLIAALNEKEGEHFATKYPSVPVVFSPVFFNESYPPVSASGDYILYHGNLSVAENLKSAYWILKNVAALMPSRKFIIAGYAPPAGLQTEINRYPNVQLIDSPSDSELENLIDRAKLHLLVTFQATGVKLKLLHVLQRRGTIVANRQMVEGTGLEQYCVIGNNASELRTLIDRHMNNAAESHVHVPELPPIYGSRTNAINLLRNIGYYNSFTDSL